MLEDIQDIICHLTQLARAMIEVRARLLLLATISVTLCDQASIANEYLACQTKKRLSEVVNSAHLLPINEQWIISL